MNSRWLLCLLCAVLFFSVLDPPTVVDRSHLAWAAEQKCADLNNQYGAGTCVCSEPLQATAYTGGPSFWDANDSTTQQCGYEVAGRPISRNAPDVQVGTDAEAMTALPAGSVARANGRFLRAAESHQDVYFVGHNFGGGTWRRQAIRVYRYYSQNFTFADERNTNPPFGTTFVHDSSTAGCRNSKWFQLEHNMIFDSHDGPVGMYGMVGSGWSPNLDCCTSGFPGRDGSSNDATASQRRGKWWRYEAVVVNPSGGASPNGLKAYLYVKNITDNTPEYKVLDTTIPCTGCGPNDWTDASGATQSLTPPSRLRTMALNNFRQHGSTQNCTGWEGSLYLLAAKWDTDTGQRILAATEVEGGGTPPPSAPFNVRIAMFILSFLGGSGGFWLFLWYITRSRVHAKPPEGGNLSGGRVRPQPPRPVEVGSSADDAELVGSAPDRAQK